MRGGGAFLCRSFILNTPLLASINIHFNNHAGQCNLLKNACDKCVSWFYYLFLISVKLEKAKRDFCRLFSNLKRKSPIKQNYNIFQKKNGKK